MTSDSGTNPATEASRAPDLVLESSQLQRFIGRITPRPLRRVPIRWRLATATALLTLIVLGVFAISVGLLVARELRNTFRHEVATGATAVERLIELNAKQSPAEALNCPNVTVITEDDDASLKLLRPDGSTRCASHDAPNVGKPQKEPQDIRGHRVEWRVISFPDGTTLDAQYARPLGPTEDTIDDIELLLVLGVVAGVILAFLVSLAVARIALDPVVELTSAAREIARTLDVNRKLPQPLADDEVGDLARMLDTMLNALERSRARTEAMLKRQREFVADASHELGTPLTSLLANLEFIVEELEGEHSEAGDSAVRSALRMKTLVADLLLLARSDAKRSIASEDLDVAAVVRGAVAEIRPLAEDHTIEISCERAIVRGVPDDLHRLVLNLLSNAVRHTPAGTRIRVTTKATDRMVQLVVEDNGPGIPPHLVDRIFERFVKGDLKKRGSTGLGLAIARAVADSHGGNVSLDRSGSSGARFVVELPLAQQSDASPLQITPSEASTNS